MNRFSYVAPYVPTADEIRQIDSDEPAPKTVNIHDANRNFSAIEILYTLLERVCNVAHEKLSSEIYLNLIM